MCSMHLLDFKINEFKQMSLYPVCFDRSGKWTSDHVLFKGTQLEGADPAITVDKFTLKAESQPLCWGLPSLDPHSRCPLTGYLFWGLLHRTFQSRSRPRCTQTLHTNTCAEIIPFHLPALSVQSLIHQGNHGSDRPPRWHLQCQPPPFWELLHSRLKITDKCNVWEINAQRLCY